VRRRLHRALLLVWGLVVGVVVGEVGLRWVKPPFSEGGILQSHFPLGRDGDFLADDECGFRPRLDGRTYNAEGCVRNAYRLERTPGRKRVLFLGDSVTRRGFIIDSLRKLYGEVDFEYWNAGVESFNAQQELIWFRRYNYRVKPDLVILSFHNNDFMNTPVVYLENGELQLLTPLHDRQGMNLWLFQNSYLYRCYLGRNWSHDSDQMVATARESLRALQALVRENGGDMRVILLPLMRPLAGYDRGERFWREQALGLFEELRLKCYDPAPALEPAFAQGTRLEQRQGDYWHPSRGAADLMARQLYESDVLR